MNVMRPARCGVWPIPGLALLGLLLLHGCATTPTSVSLQGPMWESRQASLTALRDWSLSGRISVIQQEKGWHASLRWVQTEQGYSIDITNPLGQTVARIEGDASGVRARTSDGRLLNASDPDDLMEEAIGLRIPVSGLQYWVKGLPDPAEPGKLYGDDQSRLIQLEQSGWTIEYPRYSQLSTLDLPARIRARQDDLRVQVVVDQWRL
jgi:outer membrane lipoprotein LolB